MVLYGVVEFDVKEVEMVGFLGDDRGSIGGKSFIKGFLMVRDCEMGREIVGVGRNEGEVCVQEESGGGDYFWEV